MNLCEALRKGNIIRRKSSPRIAGSNGDGWINGKYFVTNYVPGWEDMMADDWEAKPVAREWEGFVAPNGQLVTVTTCGKFDFLKAEKVKVREVLE